VYLITVNGVFIPHEHSYAGKDSCLMQGATLQFLFAIPAGGLYLFAFFHAALSVKMVSIDTQKSEVCYDF